MEGIKYDENKPMWNLLPMESVEEVVDVLTFGAKKYSPDNWKKVDKERYYAACMRHIVAWRKGETFDVESGLHHLAHAITCLLFIMEHERIVGVPSQLTPIPNDYLPFPPKEPVHPKCIAGGYDDIHTEFGWS